MSADRFALDHHVAVVAEAKDHLTDVAPELRAGLARYLELGLEPGGFLCAVLDNDLSEAVGRCADFAALKPLCLWLDNHAPTDCWGSKEKRLAWQERVSKLLAQPVGDDEPELEPRDTERPPASIDLGPIEEEHAAQ
jgi:hypothetical protein